MAADAQLKFTTTVITLKRFVQNGQNLVEIIYSAAVIKKLGLIAIVYISLAFLEYIIK